MSEPKTYTQAESIKSLMVYAKLDLIFDVDLINDRIDVRSSLIVDFNDGRVVAAQCDPPALKSMIGQALEATFISRDPVTGKMARLGWSCKIEDIVDNYPLKGETSEQERRIQALILSPPDGSSLNETNARMDYRMPVTGDKKISIQTHPSFGRVSLLDFSAGGALIGVPKPAQAKTGMKLWFTLLFPMLSSPGQQTSVTGEAQVMRIIENPDEPFARVGLKFIDLELSATRTLQKAITHYMREEQRARNRGLAADNR